MTSKDYKKHAEVCKKYERTRKGKLVRTYRNMKSRVLGIQHKKAHLYKGLELLDKDIFYKWSLYNLEYNVLFDKWVESDYEHNLGPSIDRIDTTKGYIEGNMQWVTQGKNSQKASLSRW